MVISNTIIFCRNSGKLISRKVFWWNEPALVCRHKHVYVCSINTRLSREHRKHIWFCNFHENDPNPRNLQNNRGVEKNHLYGNLVTGQIDDSYYIIHIHVHVGFYISVLACCCCLFQMCFKNMRQPHRRHYSFMGHHVHVQLMHKISKNIGDVHVPLFIVWTHHMYSTVSTWTVIVNDIILSTDLLIQNIPVDCMFLFY